MADALRVHDNVMLFSLLLALDDVVYQRLLIIVVTLREQYILRSVGDAAPQGDIAGPTSHNLDD